MMKNTLIVSALVTTGLIASPAANAALSGGEVLNFVDGVNGCIPDAGGTYPNCNYGATTVSGSYFAMDTAGDGVFSPPERIALVSAGTGITLGSAQGANTIDLTWSFGGNDGYHTTGTVNGVPHVNPDGTVDMSGWNVNWNGGDIDMGQGAAATVACVSGTMTCADGEAFILDYTAIVPSGGFAGFGYALHLEGCINGLERCDSVLMRV
jgi:hypothetical protein